MRSWRRERSTCWRKTAGLSEPQTLKPSEPKPWPPAITALLQSINQLTAMFASQSAFSRTTVNTMSDQLEALSTAFKRQLAANSVVFSVITDRLNHLKRNIETRPDLLNRNHRSWLVPPRVLRPSHTLRCDPLALVINQNQESTSRTRRISKSQLSPAQRFFLHPRQSRL